MGEVGRPPPHEGFVPREIFLIDPEGRPGHGTIRAARQAVVPNGDPLHPVRIVRVVAKPFRSGRRKEEGQDRDSHDPGGREELKVPPTESVFEGQPRRQAEEGGHGVPPEA